MAAHNNPVTNELSGLSDRLVAFFRDREDAYGAVTQLKDAGFSSDNIGLAVSHDYNTTPAGTDYSGKPHDRSLGQKIKDFFTGEERSEQTDFQVASGSMGWSDERNDYYEQGISAGGAVVTVTGPQSSEARRILEENGGDLRESGFDMSNFAGRAEGTTDAEHRIELRGELLRVFKERVKRGEIKLRKDVVTEKKTVEVPVTREELVVERMPASGQPTGDIGTDKEIRVPLSEERVRVEKQPVVNEEVRVGKRPVQRTEQVSDTVKHEELEVDKEGDVETDIQSGRKRKDPAA